MISQCKFVNVHRLCTISLIFIKGIKKTLALVQNPGLFHKIEN